MEDQLASIVQAAVALRREIHSEPEVGFNVAGTLSKIRSFLATHAKIGPASMMPCANNGLVVDLLGSGSAGDLPTPNTDGDLPCVAHVALRADTDALPMTEGNHHLPYRSRFEGAAHMCGHDGHVAALVAAAALITARLDRIPKGKRVRLLFQPAEEGPGGALPMMQAGCLESVDEVYGMHNWPTIPVGAMRVKSGALMAHVAEFKITIHGKGGHGSQPQTCVDPIVCGAAIVTALQTIVSRSLHYKDSAVVSVTMFHGGEVGNVIPDSATLTGTIRDFDASVFATIEKRLKDLVQATCSAFGATADVTIDDGYPVLKNHAPQTAAVEAVGRSVLTPFLEKAQQRSGSSSRSKDAGAATEIVAVGNDELPMAGAEDFSYFLMPQLGGKPGCFFFLGGLEESLQGLSALPSPSSSSPSSSSSSPSLASPPSPPSSGSLDQPGAFATKEANEARTRALRTNCICHGTAYDFNDNALPPAALVWVRLVEARLGVSLYDDDELSPELVAAAVAKAAAAVAVAGAGAGDAPEVAAAAASGRRSGSSERDSAAKKRKFKV